MGDRPCNITSRNDGGWLAILETGWGFMAFFGFRVYLSFKWALRYRCKKRYLFTKTSVAPFKQDQGEIYCIVDGPLRSELRLLGLGFIGFKIWGLGFTVWGLGFRVKSLGFRVLGLGFRAGFGFRVFGFGGF